MIPQTASQGEIIKFKTKNCTKSTCTGNSHRRKANYQIFLADDGRKALQLVENLLPDVILLDILLTEISRWEACRSIHRHSDEKVATIPNIMVTALRDDEDK